MKDPELAGRLFVIEKQPWQALPQQMMIVLEKEEYYQELICNLVDAHKEMGRRLSPKLHVLHSNLDVFKSNMCAYSEVNGEHQYILMFEKRYKGKYNACMIGGYLWGSVCDTKQDYRGKAENLCFDRAFHVSM